MDAQVKAILEKVASYVEATQTQLDEHSTNHELFKKRANQMAGVLANKGVIGRADVEAFVSKIASDETGESICALVEKLAGVLPVDDMGTVAHIVGAGRKLDAFEKLALFGDPHADSSVPGEVD
jgi:hypothetical protein